MAETGSVRSLGSLTGTGAGTAIALEGLSTHMGQIIVAGTFVGTVDIEVADSSAGASYVVAMDVGGNAVSGITAPAAYTLVGNATHLRANVTAYTSGTIEVRFIPLAG